MRSASSTASSIFVRHRKMALGGHGPCGPEFEQLATQVFSRQHVQGAERLIHEEHPPAHTAARESPPAASCRPTAPSIGGLKAVQATVSSIFMLPVGRSLEGTPRAATGFTFFQHREPGKEGKGSGRQSRR